MKKNEQEKTLTNTDISSNKEFETDKVKTTNVNILLNRVRLDKKRTFKKRFFFSLTLITIISLLAIYFIL